MSDTFTVPDDRAGQRIDKFLADQPSVGSRKRARQAIETGKVSVDGRPVPASGASTALTAGALVTVNWTRPGSAWNRAKADRGLTEAGLSVLYEDDVLVAVDKPPGLLTDTATHRQSRERDSVRRRMHEWLSGQGQGAHIVHRIDRDTSGVVLVARAAAAGELLREQFRQRTPERVYRALVWGIPPEGPWADGMAWDRRHRRQVSKPAGARGATLATATCRVVQRFGHLASEIEVTLESGRRNQIRLQAQLRGCPLLGETQYLPDDWRPPRRLDVPRQCLHALRLGVVHPQREDPLVIEAPLPADYLRVAQELARLAEDR
jgi:23S rRNA pseudouridine1911/1915/1917 synthase